MNWNFIPDENLNVNRVSKSDSVKKFEGGFHKDNKNLRERVEGLKKGKKKYFITNG